MRLLTEWLLSKKWTVVSKLLVATVLPPLAAISASLVVDPRFSKRLEQVIVVFQFQLPVSQLQI